MILVFHMAKEVLLIYLVKLICKKKKASKYIYKHAQSNPIRVFTFVYFMDVLVGSTMLVGSTTVLIEAKSCLNFFGNISKKGARLCFTKKTHVTFLRAKYE